MRSMTDEVSFAVYRRAPAGNPRILASAHRTSGTPKAGYHTTPPLGRPKRRRETVYRMIVLAYLRRPSLAIRAR